jgi:hypothetical protein
VIADNGVPLGSSPVKLAPVNVVESVTTKSSAASISLLAPLDGRDPSAILPSVLPVEKKNDDASAEEHSAPPNSSTAAATRPARRGLTQIPTPITIHTP